MTSSHAAGNCAIQRTIQARCGQPNGPTDLRAKRTSGMECGVSIAIAARLNWPRTPYRSRAPSARAASCRGREQPRVHCPQHRVHIRAGLLPLHCPPLPERLLVSGGSVLSAGAVHWIPTSFSLFFWAKQSRDCTAPCPANLASRNGYRRAPGVSEHQRHVLAATLELPSPSSRHPPPQR